MECVLTVWSPLPLSLLCCCWLWFELAPMLDTTIGCGEEEGLPPLGDPPPPPPLLRDPMLAGGEAV